MQLFCQAKDAEREKWDGPRTGTDGAVEVFGADQASDTSNLASHLRSVLKSAKGPIYVDLPHQTSSSTTRLSPHKISRSIIEFFTQSSKRSSTDIFSLSRKKDDADAVIAALTGRHSSNVKPLKDRIEKMRTIKSKAEIAVMHKAANISADAHAEVCLIVEGDEAKAHPR